MYFRSLSLLATLAWAGLTIAVPLGASDLTNPVGNSASGASIPAFPNLDTPALPKIPPVSRDVAHPTLPEVFKAVVLKVNPVADKLKSAVAIKAEIDAGLVVDLLHEIIDTLGWAVIQVQFIVNNQAVGVALTVEGVVLTVEAVAAIVVSVLYVIFIPLAVVVGAVDGALYTTVLVLVANIANLVAQLLTLAFMLVPGLLALIVAAIGGLTKSLYFLDVGVVIAVLGLSAKH